MKRILTIVLFLAVVACEKTDIEHNRDFDKSFQAWLSFRESAGNSYKYTTTAGSWAGASWSTVLVVSKGKVTERHFRYTAFNSVKRPETGWDEESRQQVLASMKVTAAEFKSTFGKALEEVLEWSETAATLGEHTHTSATDILTLDQIYEKARTEWLATRRDATFYFEAKNNGMISNCGYVIDGCQDDCFNGINVSEIKAL